MGRTIASLFRGPRGDISSKRFFGVACFVVAAILAFMGNRDIMAGAFLGASSSVFIASAITKT